ncbi:hypothetical protein Tco_0840902 [Tanacetum coccineum]|uniref:Retrotransposon gag domain-containing protein n=1 Tax=Tanacetum coccineum TaxID=301880 RepID=A0ABQ5AUW5_9ASTR
MELRLEKGSIKETRQKVHDMLGIPMGSRKLEDLEQRPSNDPFIKEWEEQFKHMPKPTPAAIASVISDTTEADFMVSTKLLKRITEDVDISDIDWCGYILDFLHTRADSNNTGGLDQQILRDCCARDTGSFRIKDIYDCTLSFKGTKAVVGLKRWFEKIEQVFEICKCAEDDKVKFAMCTFEGRALTWWNGNVQTLGLANANQIPWSNVKAMMTNDYLAQQRIKKGWCKNSGL